jgi:putative transposase
MQSQYQRLSDFDHSQSIQWEAIKELVPTNRKRKYSLRVIVDAIFFCLRVGNQWRNLPDSFPKWQIKIS